MGIKGLMNLIEKEAPDCYNEYHNLGTYMGREVAIDASMQLYQFMVRVIH